MLAPLASLEIYRADTSLTSHTEKKPTMSLTCSLCQLKREQHLDEVSAAGVQKARGTKVRRHHYLKLQAKDETRGVVWSSDADFTLSRHVAPTKSGFTEATFKEVLLQAQS